MQLHIQVLFMTYHYFRGVLFSFAVVQMQHLCLTAH